MRPSLKEVDSTVVAENLRRVRESIPEGVEILLATKYVAIDQFDRLQEAGIDLVGENRLQDLEEKRERWGDAFTWDFIGALQSRKVPRIAEICDRIHSVASKSAIDRLTLVEGMDSPPQILLQVNVSGEESKAGFEPGELGEAIERCPLPVQGLMTMPPLADSPEDSRVHFARLAELAGQYGLEQISMGTSQDWRVAVEEGATVIRLGDALLAAPE